MAMYIRRKDNKEHMNRLAFGQCQPWIWYAVPCAITSNQLKPLNFALFHHLSPFCFVVCHDEVVLVVHVFLVLDKAF